MAEYFTPPEFLTEDQKEKEKEKKKKEEEEKKEDVKKDNFAEILDTDNKNLDPEKKINLYFDKISDDLQKNMDPSDSGRIVIDRCEWLLLNFVDIEVLLANLIGLTDHIKKNYSKELNINSRRWQ
tara:strand:- start:12 stop:386 length:375 start_codon:yes stop_codon:yes gene_type:complete